MADAPTTVAAYCALVVRAKLAADDRLRGLRSRWRTETRGSDADVDSFRQFLVRQKVLTAYQSALLARGRADGFVIGGYTIRDTLGKGSSAGVYLAAHPSGQFVALKVLPASKAKNTRVLDRFQREGQLITRLNHPNVVRAFQLGRVGNIHFIIMEYLDGETIDDVLARRGRLPPGEAARVVHQTLLGLAHLHDERMVHRDLKPANIMASPGRQPGAPDTTLTATIKILDIGIGREFIADNDPATRDMALTDEGAVLGTPGYLAPEQAKSARSADIRSDIYSLGCVLFHALAGRMPFTDANTIGQMVEHATKPPPRLTELAPGTPPELQAVVDRMMAKRPADRYQTPAEASAALRAFLPSRAVPPAMSAVLPAFADWIESEIVDEPVGPASLPGTPTRSALLPHPPPRELSPTPKLTTVSTIVMEQWPAPLGTGDDINVELVPSPALPDVRVASQGRHPTAIRSQPAGYYHAWPRHRRGAVRDRHRGRRLPTAPSEASTPGRPAGLTTRPGLDFRSCPLGDRSSLGRRWVTCKRDRRHRYY